MIYRVSFVLSQWFSFVRPRLVFMSACLLAWTLFCGRGVVLGFLGDEIVRNKVIFARGFVLFILLSVSACAGYQAREKGMFKIGYEHTFLADGRYLLSYYGAATQEHKDIEENWARRARELCEGKFEGVELRKSHWVSDGYTVLPPFFFKSQQAAPLVEGEVRCVED